jgi:hypothetical protein
MIDYIKLARQAGIDVLEDESERASMWPATPEGLARFAELVLDEERERCAKLCEPRPPLVNSDREWMLMNDLAKRIRVA